MTVLEQLEREIADVRGQHDAIDVQLETVQTAYDLAWADTSHDQPDPRLDKLSDQTVALLNQQSNLRDALRRLESPSEAERRLQDAAGTVHDRPARATREPRASARDRGVPEDYLGEAGNFRPGMDARYKSDLIQSALGLDAPSALMTYDPADAVARLEERGWVKFLEVKRAKVEGGK